MWVPASDPKCGAGVLLVVPLGWESTGAHPVSLPGSVLLVLGMWAAHCAQARCGMGTVAGRLWGLLLLSPAWQGDVWGGPGLQGPPGSCSTTQSLSLLLSSL